MCEDTNRLSGNRNSRQQKTLNSHGETRRDFLKTLGALGAGAAFAGGIFAADLTTPRAGRIDVHHHVAPPRWVAEMVSKNLANADVTGWNVAKTLDEMEKAGVGMSVLSVTAPAVSFADVDTAKRVARESNEWTAGLRRDNPGRFGFFAMIPMQDADAALKEIEYSLDTLGADGVGLLTSYGDKWLGHAAFTPVFDELNRRKAVVSTHPTAANCCRNLLPDIPPTMIEYSTDTTRALTELLFTGTAARCPDLKMIFSHAGGTMPMLVERFIQAPVLNKAFAPMVPNGVLHELQRFYYDTAWSVNPATMAALMKVVDVPQVLFGTDFPYRSEVWTAEGLDKDGFSAKDLKAINRENALRLLPKLGKV